jgi:hypothetical protein
MKDTYHDQHVSQVLVSHSNRAFAACKRHLIPAGLFGSKFAHAWDNWTKLALELRQN